MTTNYITANFPAVRCVIRETNKTAPVSDDADTLYFNELQQLWYQLASIFATTASDKSKPTLEANIVQK